MAYISQIKLSDTTYDISAIKLKNARTINGTSFDGTGNITTTNWGTSRNIYIADNSSSNTGPAVSVNGSANVTLKLPATIKATLNGHADTATTAQNLTYCTLSGGNTYNYPYHRILYRQGLSGTYTDISDIFLISHNYDGGGFGIIKINYRTNDTDAAVTFSAQWLIRHNISESYITMASWGTTGRNCYVDVFYYTPMGWPRCTITRLSGLKSWTMVNSSEANDTTTSDKKTSTECYASIAAAGTELHGQAYTTTKTSIQIPIYGAVWN